MRTDLSGMLTAVRANGHIIVDWDAMPEWITTTEAAELSGYDVQHVRRLMRADKITGKKAGTMWWIDTDSLKTYLDTVAALGPKKFAGITHEQIEEQGANNLAQ